MIDKKLNKGSSTFKTRFCQWWGKATAALFDRAVSLQDDAEKQRQKIELIEEMIDWISAVSSSRLRHFRHTGTVAFIAVVDALIELGNEPRTERARREQQQESELRNKSGRSAERLRQYERDISYFALQLEMLDALVDKCFSTIFVHRYRDLHSVIRMLCLEALGKWVLAYPAHFLDDKKLKYFGWLLSDKDAGVRLLCLDCILSLYSDDAPAEQLEKLKLFTKRFFPRFEAMVQVGPCF
jgi:cohesin complex subunit SA-1/2